ncbi:MAG: HSF-type DNA-binding-domain-containing protein [Benjaminiella poitrasii]|nr:MAG: HSF-type DNA-binding-domain-containing protein [Benjaminiella poitrasii]
MMHRRSVSSDYHLTANTSLDHRSNSFSSINSVLSAPQQFYTTTTTANNATATSSPLPPPPPNTTQKPAHTNTFVHKLYNMVVDSHYQHLISWAYTGSSFIVCNIMEFSRDVLPKHFKHNNFSSFVRQLNMYGFHKVNKSPRGHRTLAENQIWEFSHPKFLRNRPDLLDDIKRKSMEADNARRENNDLQNHIAMLQASQSEMIQQIQHLYENFTEVLKELEMTKQKQDNQMQFMKSMMNFISQQNDGRLPNELHHNLDQYELCTKQSSAIAQHQQEKPPSIFVTSHDPGNTNNNHGNLLDDMFGVSPRSPLTVQTQDLHCNRQPMTLGPYGNQLPPSPSPSMLVSDDELDNASSLYSPNSPHTPRHSTSTTTATTNNANNSTTTYSSYMSTLDPLSHR